MPLARATLLLVTLAVALCVRLSSIGWGLPPVTPQVRASDFRSSYAFDEDDILSAVAKAGVKHFDFDPHDYHWGTLHIELVLVALDGAEVVGLFPTPWREAYYNLRDGGFQRVYTIGRLVSVATALLTVWLLFLFPSSWAGPFAAMLVAVSPTHLLQSDQVRVDVTMMAMLTLTLLAALRIPGSAGAGGFLLLGIAGGLAIAGKYSAVTAVIAIFLATLCLQRFPWRGAAALAGGALLGFCAGSPYVLIKPQAFWGAISKSARVAASVPSDFTLPICKLLELTAADVARFSIGLPAVLLAIVGIVFMLRRRAPSDWIILAATAGYAAILLPLRVPLIRYHVPLVALLGLCAGVALERFSPRWRSLLTIAALAMPIGGSIAQIHYMRAPHPANLMLGRILEVVPPGTSIARLTREMPPLDEKVYPRGPNVLLADLTLDPPAWVLTTDLPDVPYRSSTLALLQSSYDQIAHFESQRILAWATLGETPSVHDWKYTHPSFTLYRRRRP